MSKRQSASNVRLYVSEDLARGEILNLSAGQSHYVADVMRRSAGDALTLFNGRDGEWRAVLESASGKRAFARVEHAMRPQIREPDIRLAFAPLKSGHSETVARQAAELGVSRLIPVLTRHTIAATLNVRRFETILMEAAEQCERLSVPALDAPLPLERVLQGWDPHVPLIVGDESGQGMPALQAAAGLQADALGVLIGPEGGFANEELAHLRSLPYVHPVGLGPRILRADTAALALLSIVFAHHGDWQRPPSFRTL